MMDENSTPSEESAPPPSRVRPEGPPPFYRSVAPLPAAASPAAPLPRVAPVWSPPAAPSIVTAPPIVTSPPIFRAPPVEHARPTAAARVDDVDETVIVARMRPWILETEHGATMLLTKPVVLLGRNPSRGAHPDTAQLVVVPDPGRTVSRTHARLDFTAGAWQVRDLHSTNGIVLIDARGGEIELDPGVSAALGARFLLGELSARLYLEPEQ